MPFGKPSISVKELYDSSKKCAELMANENLNINDFTLPRLMNKVRHFHQTNLIVLNEAETEFVLVINERTHRLISIYAQAVMIFLDTYTIVLLAVERLCGTNKVQKLTNLVYELHVSIKNLFEQKVVTFLHSSLQDNIQSCLFRYAQLGIVQVKSYASKQQGRSEFVVVPEESRELIKETVSYLTSVRPVSQIHAKLIEEANLMAIERVVLQFPFFAHL